jgi:phage shock protein PspC (stress-responsive transcriptional regulator)
MQVNRRLYRCRDDRRLAGVAAGVAEFFDLDPTLVRILWFLSIFVGGLGLFLYVGLAIIVPLEPLLPDAAGAEGGALAGAASDGAPAGDGQVLAAGSAPAHAHVHAARDGSRATGRVTTFVGAALILFGSIALVEAVVPGWSHSWRYLWPVFLVGIGVLLLAGAVRRDSTER